ncbi:MAG: dockerin type I repeat-containing protein, partial [candidate division Zixibacteria bacterium]|nr:dockerin type I repeat-containing protein [candidate division Zixibacteria bacterium]
TEPGTDRTKMTLAARQQLYKLLQWKGFYRGDVNGDYKLDVSDVISIINYMFKSGVKPLPLVNQADVNCDGSVTTGDIIYIINYLFKSSGLAPVDKNRWKPEIAPRPGLFGDPIWKNLPK